MTQIRIEVDTRESEKSLRVAIDRGITGVDNSSRDMLPEFNEKFCT